jgi:hypothetical protein
LFLHSILRKETKPIYFVTGKWNHGRWNKSTTSRSYNYFGDSNIPNM